MTSAHDEKSRGWCVVFCARYKSRTMLRWEKVFVNHWGSTSIKSSVAKKVQTKGQQHTHPKLSHKQWWQTQPFMHKAPALPQHTTKQRSSLSSEEKPPFIKLTAYCDVPTFNSRTRFYATYASFIGNVSSAHSHNRQYMMVHGRRLRWTSRDHVGSTN